MTIVDRQFFGAGGGGGSGSGIPSSEKGAAGGVATLGPDAKIPADQLPSVSVVDFLGPAADQAAMLALTGQRGDWTARTDLGTVWIITGDDPADIDSWTQLSYPSDADATTSTKGAVQLAGDLAGTAAAPTIAASAVTTAKLNDGAVTTAKLTDGAVTDAKITSVASGKVSGLPGLIDAKSTYLGTVASQAAMLALSGAKKGDWTIRTDMSTAWVLTGTDPGVLGNWTALPTGLGSADATTTSKGLVQLAGDLSGTAASPSIAAGAVTSAKIADGTIVDADVSGTAAIAPGKVAGTAVVQARTVTAGTGLTGGGDLSADRTLTVAYGSTAGTAAQGNDSRLADTRTPTDNTVTTAKIVDGAVTSAKVADGAITSAKIVDATIVDADISGTAAIAPAKVAGTALVAANNLSDVTAATARTNLGVPPTTRTIGTSAPLTGGGDLSGDRTLGVANATTGAVGVVQLAGDLAGTATAPAIAAGAVTSAKIADGTIVDGDISGSAAIAQSKVANLATDLAGKVAKGAILVNVKDYGAVGDGTADDTAAIVAALAAAKNLGVDLWGAGQPDDYVRHDHRGVSVYFPVGSYVTNSPIVLPRSGSYRANTVGLVGQNHASSRIVAGGSFPSNRGLIEWEDVATAGTHTTVRDQEIRDLTLVPKNAVGSTAIWFKLLNSVASYGSNANNVDTMYFMRLENLVVFGHNTYHQSLIRIEGRCDYSLIRNVCADITLGAVYSTRLLHFDDISLWSSMPANPQLYDMPGFNYGVIDTLTQGTRGGLATMIYGRVNSTQIENIHNGLGALGQNPAVYIRDGGLLNCRLWTSEGKGENGIFTFENCYGITMSDFGLGTVDQATSGSPGSGLRLINVQRSRFTNRQGAPGAPAFSTYSSKLVSVDANCKDLAFLNWSGNGSLTSEWSIDAAATGIEVDYYDVTGAQRYRRGDLAVNVENYAVGNANYLSGGVWYADAGHTVAATDDTAAIRALVTAGARQLNFGSKRYRVQPGEGNALLSWAAASGVSIDGAGAVLVDTSTYTVSPSNPYTPMFEFDACTNVRVRGVSYVGPAIASPTTNHGYVGATFVRAKNGCVGVAVDAQLTNLRYGVESGAYATPSEGYNRDFDIKLRTSFCAYSQAHYLAEGIVFEIDADDVHRVSYLAGCVGAAGTARWKNEYVADTCLLITDAMTGTGTSRGCSSIDVTSIDKGSTVFQASSACAGIGLSRVDPGIVYQDIRVRVETTSTDTISSTVGGFKLYSGAAAFTTPVAPYNWESSILLRNIEVSGSVDHSAQTIDGNTAGDIYVKAWDTTSAHAATVDNLCFRNLVIKQSSGNTRSLYLEAPGAVNNGITFRDVQATNAHLSLYVSTTVPVAFINTNLLELVSSTIANRIVLIGTALGSLTGTTPLVDTISSTIGGGGAFIRTKTTLLTLTGASVTWSNAIPAGCLPLAVTGILTQTVTGATGVQVGVGADAGRYLNTNTLASGFQFGPANQSATEQTLWWAGASALNIVVTAKTSNFTAGQIRLTLTYIEFPAPTS